MATRFYYMRIITLFTALIHAECHSCHPTEFLNENSATFYENVIRRNATTCAGRVEARTAYLLYPMPGPSATIGGSETFTQGTIPSCSVFRNSTDRGIGCWTYTGLGSGGMHLLGCDNARCEFTTITNNGMTRPCNSSEDTNGLAQSFIIGLANRYYSPTIADMHIYGPLRANSGTTTTTTTMTTTTTTTTLFTPTQVTSTGGLIRANPVADAGAQTADNINIGFKYVSGFPNKIGGADNNQYFSQVYLLSNVNPNEAAGTAPNTEFQCTGQNLNDGDSNAVEQKMGMDPSGIQRVRSVDGRDYFVVVENYLPSIAFVSAVYTQNDYGRVVNRYTPVNLGPFGDIGYKLTQNLPAIYSQRFNGRGFGAVACNQISTLGGPIINGYKCWAFMESPLRSVPYETTVTPGITVTSFVYRVLEFDFSSGHNEGIATAEYVIEATVTPLSSQGRPTAACPIPDSAKCPSWTDITNKPEDLHISGAYYIDEAKIGYIERANGQVLYWCADFSNATNVLNLGYDSVEALFSEDTVGCPVNVLLARGIKPAFKTLIADSNTVENWDVSFKQSGMALAGNSLITIENNDFGMYLKPQTRVAVIQLNAACQYCHRRRLVPNGANARIRPIDGTKVGYYYSKAKSQGYTSKAKSKGYTSKAKSKGYDDYRYYMQSGPNEKNSKAKSKGYYPPPPPPGGYYAGKAKSKAGAYKSKASKVLNYRRDEYIFHPPHGPTMPVAMPQSGASRDDYYSYYGMYSSQAARTSSHLIYDGDDDDYDYDDNPAQSNSNTVQNNDYDAAAQKMQAQGESSLAASSSFIQEAETAQIINQQPQQPDKKAAKGKATQSNTGGRRYGYDTNDQYSSNNRKNNNQRRNPKANKNKRNLKSKSAKGAPPQSYYDYEYGHHTPAYDGYYKSKGGSKKSNKGGSYSSSGSQKVGHPPNGGGDQKPKGCVFWGYYMGTDNVPSTTIPREINYWWYPTAAPVAGTGRVDPGESSGSESQLEMDDDDDDDDDDGNSRTGSADNEENTGNNNNNNNEAEDYDYEYYYQNFANKVREQSFFNAEDDESLNADDYFNGDQYYKSNHKLPMNFYDDDGFYSEFMRNSNSDSRRWKLPPRGTNNKRTNSGRGRDIGYNQEQSSGSSEEEVEEEEDHISEWVGKRGGGVPPKKNPNRVSSSWDDEISSSLEEDINN